MNLPNINLSNINLPDFDILHLLNSFLNNTSDQIVSIIMFGIIALFLFTAVSGGGSRRSSKHDKSN